MTCLLLTVSEKLQSWQMLGNQIDDNVGCPTFIKPECSCCITMCLKLQGDQGLCTGTQGSKQIGCFTAGDLIHYLKMKFSNGSGGKEIHQRNVTIEEDVQGHYG